MDWIAHQLTQHDFLTGDTFTLADAYLFTVTGWADVAGIALPERLQTYRKTLIRRDSVRQAMKAESLL